MRKIINDAFEVGQRYIGMVNGAELTVVDVKDTGAYAKNKHICFRDAKTGALYEVGLEMAKRLLLRPEKG